VIIKASLFAIARVGIVALCIARGRARVVTREIAIGFATVTRVQIAVVASFEAFHFAIAANGHCSAASATSGAPGASALAATTGGSTTTSFAAGSCCCDDAPSTIASSKWCSCGKAYDDHEGREPN
jgi:hypothetical protein